jgi:hypothetical protein
MAKKVLLKQILDALEGIDETVDGGTLTAILEQLITMDEKLDIIDGKLDVMDGKLDEILGFVGET